MGVVTLNATQKEEEDVKSVFSTWNEVFTLQLKQCQKELDPKLFDKEERNTISVADVSEWRQWVTNEVVKLVPSELEGEIPKTKIISAPMRFVRTNRSNSSTDPLEAKSRLVVFGFTDPALGLYRTDAPTTSHLAVMLRATLSLSHGWSMAIFDVTTAFLRGERMTRDVFAKAPVEGLPATETFPRIKPGQLLQLLKGAYGLSEAPRLWYLRARSLLEEIGFTELSVARAVFVYLHKGDCSRIPVITH